MLIRSMEKNVSEFVVNPKRDFVRKSELSFSKTIRFILGMGSQTLGKGHRVIPTQIALHDPVLLENCNSFSFMLTCCMHDFNHLFFIFRYLFTKKV